jgi:hypothetical protein
MMKNETRGVVRKVGMLAACASGLLALALAAPALADDPGAMPGPARSMSKTMHDTVTVTGIDKSARMLTVKNEAGDTRNIQVPADVKAFDRLKKGDRIDVDYTESIALSMLPAGSKPSVAEKEAMARAGKEAGMTSRQISISAEILEVDAAGNKVVLKGPKGNARVVHVQDPDIQAKLPNLKPGQVVQVTYTEAVALAIQPRK